MPEGTEGTQETEGTGNNTTRRGFGTEGAKEEGGAKVPAFGLDVGISVTKGLFYVSERSTETVEGRQLYSGQILDFCLVEQHSASAEEEGRIKPQAEDSKRRTKKTARFACMVRWPVGPGKISEWHQATVTARASGQGPFLQALKRIRAQFDGADGGIGIRIDLRSCAYKNVGEEGQEANVLDAATATYTIHPADPVISAEMRAAAKEWLRALQALAAGNVERRPAPDSRRRAPPRPAAEEEPPF